MTALTTPTTDTISVYCIQIIFLHQIYCSTFKEGNDFTVRSRFAPHLIENQHQTVRFEARKALHKSQQDSLNNNQLFHQSKQMRFHHYTYSTNTENVSIKCDSVYVQPPSDTQLYICFPISHSLSFGKYNRDKKASQQLYVPLEGTDQSPFPVLPMS